MNQTRLRQGHWVRDKQRLSASKAPRLRTPSLGGRENNKAQEGPGTPAHGLLSIDYGTKDLSTAFRLLQPNEPPDFGNVITLELTPNAQSQPQKVAWATDGTFHWGCELDEKIESIDPRQPVVSNEGVQVDSAMVLFKLLMDNDHKDSPMGARVTDQLKKAGKDLEELVTTHLRAIVAKSREALKRDDRATAHLSHDQIDSMEIKVFISVPQMWKAPANRLMTTSAKAAGLSHVELVYEPHCAAAFYAKNVMHTPNQLSKGDILIVADIGGGTADLVSYEFGGPGKDGAAMPLSLAANPKGALCGSQFVNENFRKWLLQSIEEEFGSLTSLCERLGRSEAAVLHDAERDFESIKRAFTSTKRTPGRINIEGRVGAELELHPILIPRNEILGFFDQVIESIVECIDSQISQCSDKEKIKALIVPGGFGRSQYLMHCLSSKYGHMFEVKRLMTARVGSDEPVSRGALLRYAQIETRGLGSHDSFGVGRTETFDPDLHPDVVNTTIPKLRKGIPDRDRVKPDPFTGDINVHQRWLPILKTGDGENPNIPFTSSAWREDWVDPDDQTMSVQIYWTDSPDIAEHAPLMRETRDGEGIELDPRFQPWGKPHVKQLPDLKGLGFELEESWEQGPRYVVHSLLVLNGVGANVELSWWIARPNSRLYDENRRWSPPQDPRTELTHKDVFELVDASFNPNPRTSPS